MIAIVLSLYTFQKPTGAQLSGAGDEDCLEGLFDVRFANSVEGPNYFHRDESVKIFQKDQLKHVINGMIKKFGILPHEHLTASALAERPSVFWNLAYYFHVQITNKSEFDAVVRNWLGCSEISASEPAAASVAPFVAQDCDFLATVASILEYGDEDAARKAMHTAQSLSHKHDEDDPAFKFLCVVALLNLFFAQVRANESSPREHWEICHESTVESIPSELISPEVMTVQHERPHNNGDGNDNEDLLSLLGQAAKLLDAVYASSSGDGRRNSPRLAIRALLLLGIVSLLAYDIFRIVSDPRSDVGTDLFIGTRSTGEDEFKELECEAKNANCFFDAVVAQSSECQRASPPDRINFIKLNRKAAVAHLLNVRLAWLSRGKACGLEKNPEIWKDLLNTWRYLADCNIDRATIVGDAQMEPKERTAHERIEMIQAHRLKHHIEKLENARIIRPIEAAI